MRYIPKLLRIPVLIGLASVGLMVTSTVTAAARTAADTQPPTPSYISAIFPLGGCKVDLRIRLSSDDRTPQSQIRYQVLSNGVPIPGQLLLADTESAELEPLRETFRMNQAEFSEAMVRVLRRFPDALRALIDEFRATGFGYVMPWPCSP